MTSYVPLTAISLRYQQLYFKFIVFSWLLFGLFIRSSTNSKIALLRRNHKRTKFVYKCCTSKFHCLLINVCVDGVIKTLYKIPLKDDVCQTETESKGEGHRDIRDILKAACQISKNPCFEDSGCNLPENRNILDDQQNNVWNDYNLNYRNWSVVSPSIGVFFSLLVIPNMCVIPALSSGLS